MDQKKLREFLNDMSLDEKIGQMVQVLCLFHEKEGVITGPENTAGYTEEEIRNAGSVLGSCGAAMLRRVQDNYMKNQPHHIPLLFMADIINGYRTVFPIPLAQGCTFNPELVQKAAAVAAKESAAAGLHLTFSPMVDLVRDARWGRVMESTGEDTYLNQCMAKAMVEGYQGTGSLTDKGKIAACVKHFAGYGAPTAGRDYNTVELSERTLRDNYLPPYKAALDAGCATVMSSFNTLDRIPSAANKKLLREILRSEMGFDGVVISDWGALDELIMHGIAKDREEAAGLAAEAGVDIDMMTTCYSRHIKKQALDNQKYLELIDEAAFRILQLKNKLGLFENPYKDADEAEEAEIILCSEHRNEAKEAAIESMVLLKNDNILPLKKNGQKIAFIGPHVNSRLIYGAWSIFARPEDTVTLMEGVNSLGIKEAVFANGCAMVDSIDATEINNTKIDPEVHEKLRKEALDYALNADVVVLALGEHPLQTGEAASRAELDIPKPQLELFRQVYEVNKNIAVVLFSGRPLEIKEISDKAKAVLEVWMPGTEGGNAIAEVLFGDAVPSGKLAMSMPYCVGQVPVFYSEFHTGRPYAGSEGKGRYFSRYLDIPNKPLYPFGYGLSYTDFEISKVRLSSNELTKESSLEASVTIKNIGSFTGKEVVQLYIQDKFGSVVRPVRELKGFQKIELKPGEEKEIVFSITEEMLRFYDINMNYVSEPGEFNVYIGNSSDTQNGKSFVLI